MTYLIAGLLLFLGVHSVRIIADDWQTGRDSPAQRPNHSKGKREQSARSGLSVKVFEFSESGRWRIRKFFEFGRATHIRFSLDRVLVRLVEVKSQFKDVPMFKALICIFLVAISNVAMASQPACNAGVQTTASADETKIRSARDELNTALERRDLAVTGKYWLSDAHTTGGGGSLWVGRDKNIEGFSKIFSDPNFVSGCRKPDHVEVAVGGQYEAAET